MSHRQFVKTHLILTGILILSVSACSNVKRTVNQYPSKSIPSNKQAYPPIGIEERVIAANIKSRSTSSTIAIPAPAAKKAPAPEQANKLHSDQRDSVAKATTSNTLDVSLFDTPADRGVTDKPKIQTSKYHSAWARLASELQFIELTDHREVEVIEEWYAKHSYYMNKVGARAGRYLHYILERAKAKGLPADLALLPVVESAFDPFAYSHGQASGLWQFVPNTAKHVGLQQDWWYDGRRDVVASTDAALDYLADLNRRFDGDWLLTLAAYNSGAGTVNKAIRKNQKKGLPTDFWSLKLPSETKKYVPKFLATVSIAKNPASFNITLPDVPDAPLFVAVDTGGQIDLNQAANLAGISMDELYNLNPGVNRGITPPNGPHRLLVPVDSAGRFQTRLASIPNEDRVRWYHYKVKSGDNLSSIAKQYHIDLKVLRSTNNLKSDMLRVGQELLIPDSSDAVYAVSRGAKKEQSKLVYQIRPGDTLSEIAEQHKVSLSELRRWNHLGRDSVIKIGQKLEIWADRPAQDGVVRKVGYRVRNGDSLAAIASRFNLKVRDIVEWNSINPSNYLKPGQSLTLFVDVTRADL